MIQEPSKNLSRKFLSGLLKNNYVTDSGREYFDHEVKSLLFEKQGRLAEQEYNRSLLELARKIDHVSVIKSFQDRMINSVRIPGIVKGPEKTCQPLLAPDTLGNSMLSDNTTKSLKEISSVDVVTPATIVRAAKEAPKSQGLSHQENNGRLLDFGGSQNMNKPKKLFGHRLKGPGQSYTLNQIKENIASLQAWLTMQRSIPKK